MEVQLIMEASGDGRVGIYVRESRDDNGENHETIETQRRMLLHYAESRGLGKVIAVYEDDNVSGSGFERDGIAKLTEDVMKARIDTLLVKDLSRLGRNNAKTLQFLDFLEEYGIRVLSSDGRFDSRIGDDIVGIETWANERYVRDISRKIRSVLRFKILKGEYVGHAPYGYKKDEGGGNRLIIEDSQADTVRNIYGLYLSGFGYSAIAGLLNNSGQPSPDGGKWNRITVRRILISPVYIGNTVQGVSERISFKNKRARRLPKEAWVVTEDTHEAIVSKEDFYKVQELRTRKGSGRGPHKGVFHTFRGLIWCGGCGSTMYARKNAGGAAYLCGNYCRNGISACTSHFIRESELTEVICDEMEKVMAAEGNNPELESMLSGDFFARSGNTEADRLKKQISTFQRQQDMLYTDRLEERISEQLFTRKNRMLQDRLDNLELRLNEFEWKESGGILDVKELLSAAREIISQRKLTFDLVSTMVRRITVYDQKDSLPQVLAGSFDELSESGIVVIDFKLK